MRTGFRILILDSNNQKIEHQDKIDKYLLKAIKYIYKFQYIEASKWLFLAKDSKEKYILLSLINIALQQKDQAKAFYETSKEYPYLYADVFQIYIQKPNNEIKQIDIPTMLSS